MTTKTTLRSRISALSTGLRKRRDDRTAYLALEGDLSTYRTAREVDDLLGTIAGQDGPEAQQVRDILLDNLQRRAA